MLIFTLIVLSVSILAVAYVFLVMPRAVDGADMDLQSTDYASNGLWSKNVPKASTEAFRLAKELGYGVEISLALSRDGEIFVVSDEDLYRLCGSHKKLSSLSSAQIYALRPGIGYLLPRLCDLLSLIDGNVPILIEIKSDESTPTLCKKLCHVLDGYHGAFAIESIDPRVLEFFKKYRPRYARGQITASRSDMPTGAFSRFMLRHLFVNIVSRPDFIVTDGNLVHEPAFLLATKLFGRRGFVRPVKTERRYAICRKLSLYAIFENIRPK